MKIVITGGSGLLALNWAYFKRDEHDICLFTHTRQVFLPSVHSQKVNLLDQSELRRSLAEFRPDLVVHTAGMTNVDECERNQKLANLANVNTACNVARAAKAFGARLIHISTDHIFAGNNAFVTEEEPARPINVYAQSKLEAEQCVQELDTSALIVRTNFYGWGHRYRQSFSDWIINALRQEKTITMYDDVYYTPTLIDHVVSVAHELIDLGVSGVINVVSEDRVSKYGFGMALATVFGFENDLIKKDSINNHKHFAKRPNDMSLKNEKSVGLIKRKIGGLEEGLQLLRQQFENARPQHINNAFEEKIGCVK